MATDSHKKRQEALAYSAVRWLVNVSTLDAEEMIPLMLRIRAIANRHDGVNKAALSNFANIVDAYIEDKGND